MEAVKIGLEDHFPKYSCFGFFSGITAFARPPQPLSEVDSGFSHNHGSGLRHQVLGKPQA